MRNGLTFQKERIGFDLIGCNGLRHNSDSGRIQHTLWCVSVLEQGLHFSEKTLVFTAGCLQERLTFFAAQIGGCVIKLLDGLPTIRSHGPLLDSARAGAMPWQASSPVQPSLETLVERPRFRRRS